MPDVVSSSPSIVVIAGATASGKTGMAIDLAVRFDAEIIGADSLQIYRSLNIGTAKPSVADLARVPHHLVNCLDIDEDFSAARYIAMATTAIEEIATRGKRVIITGGTGLYIKALLGGLVNAPAGDKVLRERYRMLARRFGTRHLHQMLCERDALAAQKISPNDLPRLLRALETIEITGRSILELRAAHQFAKERYQALLIGLWLPREALFERIDRRVDEMLEAGFVEEVQDILARGYLPMLKPLRAVGYKQIIAHLNGKISLEQTAQVIKRETKKYAKRQLNWFKTQQALEWFPANDSEAIALRVAEFWGCEAPNDEAATGNRA